MGFKSHMHPWREKQMALAEEPYNDSTSPDLDGYLLGMDFIEYSDWRNIEAELHFDHGGRR
jgi:hypothetical protein